MKKTYFSSKMTAKEIKELSSLISGRLLEVKKRQEETIARVQKSRFNFPGGASQKRLLLNDLRLSLSETKQLLRRVRALDR